MIDPSGGEYEEGSVVEMTANASDEWRFVRWEGDLNGSESVASLTINGDKDVTAVFELREYDLKIEVEGEGRVDEEVIEDPARASYPFGSLIELTAVPEEDWRFVGWDGDLTGTENPESIMVEGPKKVTAEFVEVVRPLWAMGYNHNGQLGDGTSGEGSDRNVPTQGAHGFFEVEEVSGGGFHSLILGMDGTLMSVGYNGFGQLGDGTFTQRVTPVEITDDVEAISGGEHHSLLLKSNGTLWTMGGNDYGQLGNGSTTEVTEPQEVRSNVSFIVAGDRHSLFITDSGELWGMGKNTSGQLGFTRDASGDTTAVVPNPDPVRIEHTQEVVQAAAGGGHTLFIDSEGSLYGVGDNSRGQLGLGPDVDYTEEPLLVAENVQRVTTGRDHTLFVQNGDLYAMGSFARGKLGTGNEYNHFEPEFVDSNVNLIAGGLYHSLYTKNDESLWGMGENARGQLGDGSQTDQLTPVKITEGVIRVAAGIRHTLLVKE